MVDAIALKEPGRPVGVLEKSFTFSMASEFGSNSSNVNIPDNNSTWSAFSAIFINGAPNGATVTTVDVHVEIIHTYVGDLEVALANSSRSVWLWQRAGGSDDNINVTYTNVTNFAGDAVNQNWVIWARDLAASDVGYIDYWWIRIYYNAPDPPDPDITFESSLPGQIELGQTFDLEVRAKNEGGDATYGSISISFPQFTSSGDGPQVTPLSGTSSASPGYQEFRQGVQIYHRNGNQFPANYLLSEFGDINWTSNKSNTLRIRVKPKNTGTFVVYIRANMGLNDDYYNDPTSSGYTDQQGWSVLRRTVNVVPPSGDLGVTIENINGTSTPLPGPNASVQLYNSNDQPVGNSDATNNNGTAQFFDVEAGSGYAVDVSHNPNNPTTIFGQEYWGRIGGITVTANTTNITSVRRNMPYGSEVKLYLNGQEVNEGTVTVGTTLQVKMTITNPNFPGSEGQIVQGRVVIDRDFSSSGGWDYDRTSSPQGVNLGQNTTVTLATFTLTEPGAYAVTMGTKSLVDGSYTYTDGSDWAPTPIITVYQPVYGTTILTHGYVFNVAGIDYPPFLDPNLTKDWMNSLALAIAERAGKAEIRYYNKNSGTFDLQNLVRNENGDQVPYPQDPTGEQILLFDWAEESNENYEGFSEGAGDALFAALIMGEQNGVFSLDNLHFIGHSRGTVVNTEAVERLVALDRTVDHVTNIDAHDWGFSPFSISDDHDNHPNLNILFPQDRTPNNGTVSWKARSGALGGVTWSDSYWQHNSPFDKQEAFQTLDGRPVQGTFNEDWSEISPEGGETWIMEKSPLNTFGP